MWDSKSNNVTVKITVTVTVKITVHTVISQ